MHPAEDIGQQIGIAVELLYRLPAVLGDRPGSDSEKWTDIRQLAEHGGGLGHRSAACASRVFVVEHELSVGRVETQWAAVENSADVSGEHELLGSRVEQRATGVEQPHPVGDPQREFDFVR